MLKTAAKIFLIVLAASLSAAVFKVRAATPPNIFYLTWETDGGAPVGYSGKTLTANGGVIKVSIQPLIYSSGSYLDSSQWDYKWYLNDELSGQGENMKIFRFRLNELNSANYVVKVKIMSGERLIQEKEITIPIATPKVVIKPLAANILLKQSVIQTNDFELKLVAIPYFFGNNNANLKLSWYLNDEKQKSDTVQDGILTVKKNSSTSSYDVSALMTVDGAALTRAVNQVQINFNNL